MDWLLSEEFVSFSQKVSDIYGEKKKLKQELKDYYDKSQTKLKELEQQAQVLQEEFEKWKKTQTDDQKSLTKAK
jgi:hypothetical protein